MEPLGGSQDPSSTSVHTLTLAGKLCGSSLVLVRTRMTFSPDAGVTVEMSVRAEEEGACEFVLSAIG